LDSNRIPKNDGYTAHRIGDLVRVSKYPRERQVGRLQYNAGICVGSIGVVTKTPQETGGILFIEVYVFKNNETRFYTPQEVEIISNIDT
jgi:hypothetical protein